MPESSSRDYMQDLFGVGWTKPMGYLPIRAIGLAGWDVDQVLEWLSTTELNHIAIDEDQGHVVSGALYVWHAGAVQRLLDLNPDILRESGWPSEAGDFVLAVATRDAEGAAIYDLVGVLFSDPRMLDSPHVRRPPDGPALA